MVKFVLLVESPGHAVTFSSLGQVQPNTVRGDLLKFTRCLITI